MTLHKRIASLLLACALALPAVAHAADEKLMLSIEDALNSDLAKEKLDPNIAFRFARGGKGKVLGEWVSNKKTNSFGKDNAAACQRAFISALLEFQERARKEGGSAVVNIRSYYKSEEISNAKEYMCGSGFLMAGVALKAQVLK
ncbi:excinuclease ATPase subunit [Chromobacterium sp. Beijing]|uniref:excinuclease ATPase subunit n=1 Tax=Chromobacterium sp. Beijing TaxID=2735795 RepID=UPI001F1D8FE1|nr:excinuclease ATPase subunit [Chromobacterium sp. Beijing]UJB34010.1 excinuclease ABC subunit A [Chromobacterium sp. Beijing]